MPAIISRGTPVAGVPWKSMQISGSQAQRIMSTGNPGFLFPQPQGPPPGPDLSRPTNVGGGTFAKMPITPQQVARLLQGENPATVLAQPPPAIAQPIAPGYPQPRTPQPLPISGLPRQGQYMYGGPEPVPGFPWRTNETVPPAVPPPPQPALPQPKPQVTRQPTGVDQTPSPVAPDSADRTQQVPITSEEARRLLAGETPSNVLGSNILPVVPPASPLPPAQTPESIGMATETPTDQLKGLPWESMELSQQELPDFMSHVTTDPNVLAALQNLIPDAPWISDTMRPGPGSPPQSAPIPVPVPEQGYLYSGGIPVSGFPWVS